MCPWEVFSSVAEYLERGGNENCTDRKFVDSVVRIGLQIWPILPFAAMIPTSLQN
jgi:hypothetical protein